MKDYKPQTIKLDPEDGLRRSFLSTKSHIAGVSRLDEYDYAEYEQLVVFYDVYLSAEGTYIEMIGPPPLNLRSHLFPLEIYDEKNDLIAQTSNIREYERSCFIKAKINKPLDASQLHRIRLEFNNGLCKHCEVHARQHEPVFLQMSTLQKNNPVEWITDWISYHDKLGIDRFLIYDNGSEDSENLRSTLKKLSVNASIELIDWPFKYGTIRSHKNKFCPNAQRNHSVHRYGDATWSGFFDIDEYVKLKQGVSIKDLLMRQYKWVGALRVDNYIVPDQVLIKKARTPPSYLDFEFRERHAKGKAHKYFLKTAAHKEAKTHNARLKGLYIKKYPPLDSCHFLHYRGLNTNWKLPKLDQPPKLSNDTHEKIAN